MTEAERLLTYAVNVACQTELPAIADAQAASLANVIDDQTWNYWISANGLCPDHAGKLRFAARRKPEYLDLLRLWLRGYLTEQQVDGGLRNLGWLDPNEVAAIKQFAQELPNPSDLVRFAVRHVFEPSLANKFGFSDELNPNFIDWHAKLGFGYDVPIQDPIDGQQYTINWATAQWWSHWVWPSPQQAVQAGFRFRPDRDRSNEDADTSDLDVDPDTVSLLLRGNDYPPQFRSIIAGLGRPLPGLRQLSRAMASGSIDRSAAVEVFRKQGYPVFWAGAMADGLVLQARDANLARAKRESGGAIEAAWDIGAISDQEYSDYLRGLGLSPELAAESVFFARAKRLNEQIKRRLKIYRAGFLRGTWSKEQVTQFLTETGLQTNRIQDYMDEWELELKPRRREVSRGELKRLACDGLIDLPTLVQRLQNLGWAVEDIAITVGEVDLCVAQKTARLLQQQQNLVSKSQRAARQAVQQAAALLRQQQAQLAKHGTPRQLATWYWEGTLPLDEVYARLAFLGWPDADIERLLVENQPSQPRAEKRAEEALKTHGAPVELAKWYAAGTIGFDEAVSRLRFLGWPDPDIARLIIEHKGTVPAGFGA
jgi:hypothetical protein